ncbi:MAG: hypothetical protein H6510_17745 [Acidobacteria bacterium]|nr:hypothetical protein [Acidobacteriota bacterium]MCB9399660.1 hypothetical protein [Acidobacteriota bacterium]
MPKPRPILPLGIGLVAGLAIAFVDNVAFGGETSPIVIVGLLLAASASAGWVWGVQGWSAALGIWLWVPLAHLLKHLFGLPDTLQPNTYPSILLLAGFSFLVSALGYAAGLLIHKVQGGRSTDPSD